MDEIERVTRWWHSARNELERFEPALRHGDPWYGNLLVDESGELTSDLGWEGFGDEAELAESVAKLRAGPILSG